MIQVYGAEIQAIAPALILVVFGIMILLLDMFQKRDSSREYLAYVAIAGLLTAGVSAFVLWNYRVGPDNHYLTLNLFSRTAYLDGFTQALTCIFVLGGILTCLISKRWLASHGIDKGEYYVLILFSTVGMIFIAAGSDLITIFLGLETMSIAGYVLAGFQRDSRESAEASMKYLILGALSTGILLFGIALVYGATGSTNLAEIGAAFSGADMAIQPGLAGILAEGVNAPSSLIRDIPGGTELVPIAYVGMLAILVGIGFKIAVVPFHMWVPDVYSGTPTPAVGFMATAIKAAGFAALLRVFTIAFFGEYAAQSTTGWVQILWVIALLTLIVGNFGALVQNNVKRMLAYSSIAHAGFLLIPFVASGYTNQQHFNTAIIFYLVAYTFTTLGAFGVLAYLGRKGEEVKTFADLDGLGLKYPWIGVSMMVFMLSLAGIPPTAGFMAKLFSLKTAVDAAWLRPEPGGSMFIILAVVGILVSVAGIYYYLRVIVHMYMRQATRVIRPLRSKATAVAIGICLVATLLFGVWPNRLYTLSNMTVSRMADSPAGPVPVDYTPPVEAEDLLGEND
jgi:NADH-quinone oxidoreductase subunit N